jgi:hypothetical protein
VLLKQLTVDEQANFVKGGCNYLGPVTVQIALALKLTGPPRFPLKLSSIPDGETRFVHLLLPALRFN